MQPTKPTIFQRMNGYPVEEPPASVKFKNSCKYALLCVSLVVCCCLPAAAPWDMKPWYNEVTTRKQRKRERKLRNRMREKGHIAY